jgi:uncharacterized short protein YbdD (DUF466 family)
MKGAKGFQGITQTPEQSSRNFVGIQNYAAYSEVQLKKSSI